MVIDVRKAHWNAPARRTIYIKLPAEDDEPGMCGLCLKALYGFLDAASCWNDEVSDMLTEDGFHVGKASPALCRHDGDELCRTPVVRTSSKPALLSETNTR